MNVKLTDNPEIGWGILYSRDGHHLRELHMDFGLDVLDPGLDIRELSCDGRRYQCRETG